MRSTDGEVVWAAAHEMVQRFATKVEYAELIAEYGGVQPGNRREKVEIPGTGGTDAPTVADLAPGGGAKMGGRGNHFSESTATPFFRRNTLASGAGPRKHDPTRAKPLVVLAWLRINIERMVKSKAIELTQLQNLSALINGLVAGYKCVTAAGA